MIIFLDGSVATNAKSISDDKILTEFGLKDKSSILNRWDSLSTEITFTSSSSITYRLPVGSMNNSNIDVLIDWGDGSSIENWNATINQSSSTKEHSYSAGTYTIKILGDIPMLRTLAFSNATSMAATTHVVLGDNFTAENALSYAFRNHTGLTNFSVKKINCSRKFTDLKGMFNNVPTLTTADFTNMDSSNVTSWNGFMMKCGSVDANIGKLSVVSLNSCTSFMWKTWMTPTNFNECLMEWGELSKRGLIKNKNKVINLGSGGASSSKYNGGLDSTGHPGKTTYTASPSVLYGTNQTPQQGRLWLINSFSPYANWTLRSGGQV